MHISRYIHLNPHSYGYKTWPSSSYRDYIGKKNTEWLQPTKILDLFASQNEYKNFTADYEDAQKILDDLKHQLADR